MQSKLYDEEGCVDLNKQDGNGTLKNPKVQELLKNSTSWPTMWLQFGQQVYSYDDNFRAVSRLCNNNDICKNKVKHM